MKKKKRKIKKRKTARGKPKDENLTFKQQRFVMEYIKEYEGTKSAIKAGYGEKGAHVRASELLQMPKIKEAIEKLQKKIADKCEITKEKILKDLELTRLKSLENKKFTPAHRCSELQGKSIALFTDKNLIGEDRENPFGAEEVKAMEEGLLHKLQRLAGELPWQKRRGVIDLEPEPEEKKMITTLTKRRKLNHIRKRHGVKKRKSREQIKEPLPEPEEELDYSDYDEPPEEEYCPMPNRDRKASFADFPELSEENIERRIRNRDLF